MNALARPLFVDGADESASTLESERMLEMPKVVVTPPTVREKRGGGRIGLGLRLENEMGLGMGMGLGNQSTVDLPMRQRGGGGGERERWYNLGEHSWRRWWKHLDTRKIISFPCCVPEPTIPMRDHLPRSSMQPDHSFMNNPKPMIASESRIYIPHDGLKAPPNSLEGRYSCAADLFAAEMDARTALRDSPKPNKAISVRRKNKSNCDAEKNGGFGFDGASGTAAWRNGDPMGKQPLALLMMRRGGDGEKKGKGMGDVLCVRFIGKE